MNFARTVWEWSEWGGEKLNTSCYWQRGLEPSVDVTKQAKTLSHKNRQISNTERALSFSQLQYYSNLSVEIYIKHRKINV
jgi:hypothetical protein